MSRRVSIVPISSPNIPLITHASYCVLGNWRGNLYWCLAGHLTTKSDVYSFGVVLLELMTGRKAVDRMRAKTEQNLVDWARPYLTSSRRLRCIMDPRLAGQYSIKGAKEMALLALQCTSLNPKDRPKMPSVIETLEALLDLKDMAVSHGQWPATPKSAKVDGVSPNKGGHRRKPSPVAPTRKTWTRYRK